MIVLRIINFFFILKGRIRNFYNEKDCIIWISTLFVIWKDRNDRIFDNHFVQLTGLLEKVKLQTYWWLKAKYMTFDFDYPFWRQNPLCCNFIFGFFGCW